jgi:hypothetical protein
MRNFYTEQQNDVLSSESTCNGRNNRQRSDKSNPPITSGIQCFKGRWNLYIYNNKHERLIKFNPFKHSLCCICHLI